MIKRMPTHCGDDTCASCVVAGDFIFLAHHAGGFDSNDLAVQTRAALESAGRTLATVGTSFDDVVQVNYYIKSVDDFRKGADVFREFFKNGPPARMTVVTDFISSGCLCMIDGVAYRPVDSK